jgi:hypothetical protein
MKTKKGGEALKVFVRVRPPISAEVSVPNAVLTSREGVNVSSAKANVQCSYDMVFGETSEQSDVFSNVKPLLNDVLNGINGTVFAYGQTSAGKSHTMIGPNGGANVMRSDPEFWGLLPRSSEYLLNTLSEKERQGQISYKVTVSFMEIYNETLTDLLSNARYSNSGADGRWAGSNGAGNGLKIREMARSETTQSNRNEVTAPQEVYVAGLSEFRVHTAADVMKLVAIGTNNRTISSTEYNDSSSRSHAVLQFSLEIEKRGDAGEAVIFNSKLSLADLAGSEKIDTSSGQTAVGLEASGDEQLRNQRHLRELTSINKSLSCLGNVISALSSATRTHIPYRESKLTRLLQDSLGGNTRTILIACCAPTEMHVSETVSTLQFADRAKSVMLKVKANTVVDDKAALARAREEIRRLQGLLAKALAKLEAGGSGSEGGAGTNGASALAAELRSSVEEGASSGTGTDMAGRAYREGEDRDGDISTRERLLIQENASLQEENSRLRARLKQGKRGKGVANPYKPYPHAPPDGNTNTNTNAHAHSEKVRTSQSGGHSLGHSSYGPSPDKGGGGGGAVVPQNKRRSRTHGKSVPNGHHQDQWSRSLMNRGSSYFAGSGGRGQDTHNAGGGAVRVYGSAASAKLLKSLKTDLKTDSGKSGNGNGNGNGHDGDAYSSALSPSGRYSLSHSHSHSSGAAVAVAGAGPGAHHQHFSGFASTVIAQATGTEGEGGASPARVAEREGRAMALARINNNNNQYQHQHQHQHQHQQQRGLSMPIGGSGEKTIERLNSRERGLSSRLAEAHDDLKGEKAYLDSLTAARQSMERQLAELAGAGTGTGTGTDTKKKGRASSSSSRRRKRRGRGQPVDVDASPAQDQDMDGDRGLGIDIDEVEGEGEDEDGIIDINGASLGHGAAGANNNRADALRQCVQHASASQQLPSPTRLQATSSSPALSPVQRQMQRAGIPPTIAGILSPHRSPPAGHGLGPVGNPVDTDVDSDSNASREIKYEGSGFAQHVPLHHLSPQPYRNAPQQGSYADSDNWGQSDQEYNAGGQELGHLGWNEDEDEDDNEEEEEDEEGENRDVANLIPSPSQHPQQERGSPLKKASIGTSSSHSHSHSHSEGLPVSRDRGDDEDEDEGEPFQLNHSMQDIGRRAQMFSFLKNDWVDIHIEGFDPQTGAHKITHSASGKNEWQNLRRKAVRRPALV